LSLEAAVAVPQILAELEAAVGLEVFVKVKLQEILILLLLLMHQQV
tara:strand:- start:332 stop:469 length:138 start_codon:yes stop_codon:yes gene_type:complete